MKKSLTDLQLTWKKTIIFAVLAGVYTGVVALIPALKDTSLQDISISFECWIFFGVLIIMNSESRADSALKCFVFFLISQPLVYLVQVPFNPEGFGLFRYYKPWLRWTLLTLPMGYLGCYMKRGGWIALLILSPILLFLGVHVHSFLGEVVSFFPNHLLSLLFCVSTMFFYVSVIVTGKGEKKAGYALCALILAACLALTFVRGSLHYETTLKYSDEELYFDDSYRVSLADDAYGKVAIGTEDFDGVEVYCITAEFTKTGETMMILENDRSRRCFALEIGRNTYTLRELPE